MRSNTSERNGLPFSERSVPRRTRVATVAFFTPQHPRRFRLGDGFVFERQVLGCIISKRSVPPRGFFPALLDQKSVDPLPFRRLEQVGNRSTVRFDSKDEHFRAYTEHGRIIKQAFRFVKELESGFINWRVHHRPSRTMNLIYVNAYVQFDIFDGRIHYLFDLWVCRMIAPLSIIMGTG